MNTILWIGTNQPDITVSNLYIRNTTYQAKGGGMVNITSNTRIFFNSKFFLKIFIDFTYEHSLNLGRGIVFP